MSQLYSTTITGNANRGVKYLPDIISECLSFSTLLQQGLRLSVSSMQRIWNGLGLQIEQQMKQGKVRPDRKCLSLFDL